MDETIILSKIESLKRCVDRIAAKTPASKDVRVYAREVMEWLEKRKLKELKPTTQK